MPVISQGAMAPLASLAGRRLNTSLKFSVPTVDQTAMMPRAKPTSPTRLTRKAFLAASEALPRRYQKPISR